MGELQRSAGRILRGKWITAVVSLSVLLTFALPTNAQVPSGFIVMFEPGTTSAARADSAQRAGAFVRFDYSIVEAIAIETVDANASATPASKSSIASAGGCRRRWTVKSIETFGGR